MFGYRQARKRRIQSRYAYLRDRDAIGSIPRQALACRCPLCTHRQQGIEADHPARCPCWVEGAATTNMEDRTRKTTDRHTGL